MRLCVSPSTSKGKYLADRGEFKVTQGRIRDRNFVDEAIVISRAQATDQQTFDLKQLRRLDWGLVSLATKSKTYRACPALRHSHVHLNPRTEPRYTFYVGNNQESLCKCAQPKSHTP